MVAGGGEAIKRRKRRVGATERTEATESIYSEGTEGTEGVGLKARSRTEARDEILPGLGGL